MRSDNGGEVDVLEFDGGVVALQIDRAGSGWIGVDGSARRPDHGLVVDDLHPVQDDGDVTVHEGDVVGLPFTTGFAGVYAGGDAAEDGTDALESLHATVAIDHLGFINAAEINAAIALRSDEEFGVQPEVFERGRPSR
jgi:hypothetical protein